MVWINKYLKQFIVGIFRKLQLRFHGQWLMGFKCNSASALELCNKTGKRYSGQCVCDILVNKIYLGCRVNLRYSVRYSRGKPMTS
jgi:hypothetical protein